MTEPESTPICTDDATCINQELNNIDQSVLKSSRLRVEDIEEKKDVIAWETEQREDRNTDEILTYVNDDGMQQLSSIERNGGEIQVKIESTFGRNDRTVYREYQDKIKERYLNAMDDVHETIAQFQNATDSDVDTLINELHCSGHRIHTDLGNNVQNLAMLLHDIEMDKADFRHRIALDAAKDVGSNEISSAAAKGKSELEALKYKMEIENAEQRAKTFFDTKLIAGNTKKTGLINEAEKKAIDDHVFQSRRNVLLFGLK